ncbi:MAG: type IV conjugative transfer system coupling protein TraD [Legionella sp.]
MNESNSKLFTRGGQISFHNIRMFFQINKTLWNVGLLAFIGCVAVLTYWFTPYEIKKTFFEYNRASILGWFDNYYELRMPIQGKQVLLNSKALLKYPYFAQKADLIWTSVIEAVVWSSVIMSCAFVGLVGFFIVKGKEQGESTFLRGSVLASSRVLAKKIYKAQMASDLVIDGVPIIKQSEVQHFLIHGTIGTGKSQLMMKFLEQIRRRGDRVIIYDKGCSFTSHFFDEHRDVILNPFDSRCANWDMWGEAPRDSDFENMAESLIPLHGNTDPFWVDAARTVFSSVAMKLRDDNPSIDKLLDILLTSDFEHLEPFLKGTAAATLVSGKIEKTAISIRSVITTYLKSLQSLKGLNNELNPKFTIRDYILDANQKGWLFISSKGEQHATLKPLISMWLAMASLTLLSLEEDRTRRIWFICDELPSLHRLPLLAETIAEVRKFGGCFMLGMQSQAQLGKVYGRDAGAEIFDLLNTRYFFRSPSHEMAKLVANELGEEEIEESTESYSYGANSIRDGISVGKHKSKRLIVTYPEIMQLKDMQCYLRLPADYPVVKLQLTFKERKKLP